MTKTRQAGDTLVEVLIAIMVVSTVLGSTFVVMNRSFNNTRQSQERLEAVKILEAQLEQVKAKIKDPTSGIVAWAGGGFCMNAGVATDASNGVCQSFGTVPGGYKIAITKSADYLFTANVRWDSVNRQGEDTASLVYRVYP